MNKKVIGLTLLASTAYLCGSSPKSPLVRRLSGAEVYRVSSGSTVINKDVPFFLNGKINTIALRSTFDSDVLLKAVSIACYGKESALTTDGQLRATFTPLYKHKLPGRAQGAGEFSCSFGDRVLLEGFLRSFSLKELLYFSVRLEGSDRSL